MLIIKNAAIALAFTVLLQTCVLAAPDNEAPPANGAGAMLLLQPESGTVLASHNADERMLIASTTKLMTALIAAESLEPDRIVEIRSDWTEVEGSSMYLRPGESYTVRELLQGLLLASGNDAALALAETAAGDVDAFVRRMNDKCTQLALTGTHFENPHGLDAPENYSTATDLARIMFETLSSPLLREIMSMRSCSIQGLVYENHNRLLRSCPGVFAGKTGYTMAAGRCLVSCCERDGLELICVTLSDKDDWKDHAALYDWAYANYCVYKISAGEDLAAAAVISGNPVQIGVTTAQDICLCIPKGAGVSIACLAPEFVFAPVLAGTIAGEMSISVDDIPVGTWPLVWDTDVGLKSSGTGTFRDMVDRFAGVYRI